MLDMNTKYSPIPSASNMPPDDEINAGAVQASVSFNERENFVCEHQFLENQYGGSLMKIILLYFRTGFSRMFIAIPVCSS